MAVGIHMSGIYMGQALGGIGGWIAQDISWRAAFFSCGLAGVIYAGVLVIFLTGRAPDPDRSMEGRSGWSGRWRAGFSGRGLCCC